MMYMKYLSERYIQPELLRLMLLDSVYLSLTYFAWPHVWEL